MRAAAIPPSKPRQARARRGRWAARGRRLRRRRGRSHGPSTLATVRGRRESSCETNGRTRTLHRRTEKSGRPSESRVLTLCPVSGPQERAREKGPTACIAVLLPVTVSILLAIALASLCFGCSWVIGDTPMSTVHPTTPEGRVIQSIYAEITWIVLAIFVVVEGLLLYAILRFRQKPGDAGVPDQVHGNTVLEIGWTIIPVLIVMAIAVPTLRGTCALQEPPVAQRPHRERERQAVVVGVRVPRLRHRDGERASPSHGPDGQSRCSAPTT